MKVLILSHNPITTYQNMGKTLLSLFSSFEKSELCQLYIYPTIPDIDKCSSYYRITDRDIFMSYVNMGRVKSRVINSDEININRHSLYETKGDELFLKKNKKSTFTLFCRDIMWFFSNWYNSNLREWLNHEKPTCIYLVPGRSKFIYNVALKISRKLNIPIITYLADEYYFVKKPSGVVDRLYLYLLKKKMNLVMRKSQNIVTICDEMTSAYMKEFSRHTYTVLTGTNFHIADAVKSYSEIKGLTYMGNIGCNRYVSIAEIGRCLDEINTERGTDFSLFLYTNPYSDEIKKIFSDIRSIRYCGYVTGNEFDKILHESPILVHVESFDEDAIDRVKHSISTKIADSLGSGNLLFAYGPEQVASIRHLMKYSCASIALDQTELKSALYDALMKKNREDIVKKALLTAKEHHISENTSLRLRTIIDDKE